MLINIFILFLLFFAITPNLGFFNPGAFTILTGILVIFVSQLIKPLSGAFLGNKESKILVPLSFTGLIFLAAPFYGGLYQDKLSLPLGSFLIGGIAILSLSAFLWRKSFKKFPMLPIAIVVYFFLSWWTIGHSPSPQVDSFVILHEAPLKLLSGENPYSAIYTRVYHNITPDYFSYLPLTFFYTLPFVLFFGDPRYGIIVANLISIWFLWKLFKDKKSAQVLPVFLTIFLFLPRSFYILEHMYLDPIIFAAFLGFFYLLTNKRKTLTLFTLSFFFSFKQHLIILFPLLLGNSGIKDMILSKRMIYFLAPFFLIALFFAVAPGDFLHDLVFFYSPDRANTPIALSLSLPTLIRNYLPYFNPTLVNYSGVLPLIVLFLFLLRNKMFFVEKMVIGLFLFNFFTYQSYFNNYYSVAMFLFFSIMLRYFGSNSGEKKYV